MGLYNDPAGTRALFPGDRLLRTGEFGSLDGRGRLTVTGRRRNLLSFKSGKTVSPEELEILLAGIPYIGDAVVFAAGEAETGVELRLCAEVTLREETVRALTKEQRLALVKREISALNASLPPYKRLRQVRIRTEGGTPASEEAPDPVLPPEDLPAEATAETPAGAPEQAQPAPEAASSSEPAPEKSKDPGDAGL